MGLGEKAAMTLALVIHELATNSVKYGSLSVPEGTLDVSCIDQETELVVTWTERGGPSVRQPSGSGGFGSKLVTNSVAGQLSGSLEHDWAVEGLVVTLRLNRE